MATKEEMKRLILQLEPSNEVASSPDALHEMLKTELTQAKRRASSSNASSSISCLVHYKLEDGENMSWKICRKDTGEPVSTLFYGLELPLMGTVENIDNIRYRITSQKEGLGIVAGDLEVRERFDSRRIYGTPNGTSVVFKRVENNRIVLWSYKTQTEIMLGSQVAMRSTSNRAKPTARRTRKMTQKILAAYLISDDPTITGESMTSCLRDAFPNANIGSRHGPHYLSLSRKGRLPEAPESDPRTW